MSAAAELRSAGRWARVLLVDRYILSGAMRPFAIALGVTLAALLLERLLRLFNLMAETGSSFGIVLELAGNLVPHYLGLALPASFFIAVFASAARLAEENELDAMLASGVSIYRLSQPYIAAGCGFALLSILLFGFVQPYSRYAYQSILHIATNAGWEARIQPHIVTDINGKYVLSADAVDITGTQLTGVFLRQATANGEQAISAASGQLQLSEDRSRLYLLLENGVQLEDASDGKPHLVKFERILGNVSFNPDAPPFRARGETERELTLLELYQAIKTPGATTIQPARLIAELNARIVRALSLPFLPLLAIPLALTAKRQRRSSGLLVAMLLLLLYHHAVQAAETLGDTGQVPPATALWLVFYFFVAFCIWLFVSSSRRPGDNPISRSVERVGFVIRTLAQVHLPAWLGRKP